MKTKYCWKCKETKPVEDFYKNRAMSDGLNQVCRPCCKERFHALRVRRAAKGLCHCGQELSGKHKTCAKCRERCSSWSKENRERKNGYAVLARAKIKKEIINHYGGEQCSCLGCEVTEIEFLSIDHIAGNGNEHRRSIKKSPGEHFYRWLKKNGFPAGYRVLCIHCNMALGTYGYCPQAARRAKRRLLDLRAEAEGSAPGGGPQPSYRRAPRAPVLRLQRPHPPADRTLQNRSRADCRVLPGVSRLTPSCYTVN